MTTYGAPAVSAMPSMSAVSYGAPAPATAPGIQYAAPVQAAGMSTVSYGASTTYAAPAQTAVTYAAPQQQFTQQFATVGQPMMAGGAVMVGGAAYGGAAYGGAACGGCAQGQSLFDRLDRNHDGSISRQEFAKVMGGQPMMGM